MRSSGHGKGQVCESRGMALHVSSAIASVYRHDRLGLRRLTRAGSHENRRALLLTAASTALASVYVGRRRTRPVDSTATTCTRTVATRRTRSQLAIIGRSFQLATARISSRMRLPIRRDQLAYVLWLIRSYSSVRLPCAVNLDRLLELAGGKAICLANKRSARRHQSSHFHRRDNRSPRAAREGS